MSALNGHISVVLTVGNSMMGDDGAGPMLAALLEDKPVEGWVVIDGGSTPENVVHEVRALKPARVLIVDAAEMELPAGEIRLIDPGMIAEMFLMSTHNLPLSFLIDQLEEDVPDIKFLGIQPGVVAFYYLMTDAVKQAVEKIYQCLPQWQGSGNFAWLECRDDELQE